MRVPAVNVVGAGLLLFVSVINGVLTIPRNCTDQLSMPCNVTLKYGAYSKVGEPVGPGGGVSAASAFNVTYSCDQNDTPVLHLAWKPSDDSSFDDLTGYAITIDQSHSLDDDFYFGDDTYHLLFTVNSITYHEKSYLVRKLVFKYDLPGQLADRWVYDVTLVGLPDGTEGDRKIQRELSVRSCPTPSLPTDSVMTSPKIVHASPTTSTSTLIPPDNPDAIIGVGAGVCVVIVAAVITAVVVFLIRNSKGPQSIYDVNGELGKEKPDDLLEFFKQEVYVSVDDSGLGDEIVGDKIHVINDEYDTESVNSWCSSYVPATHSYQTHN